MTATFQPRDDKMRKTTFHFYPILIALALLFLLVMWLINMDILTFSKTADAKTSQLEKDGIECVNIAENAVANMVAVVEFQKLEIIGRKARVMRLCMDDHGYQQNPAWTDYAKPIAEKTAKDTQVSFDEAYENLRRNEMVIFKPANNQPSYWISKAAK
jgi:hypothetical protein